MMPSKLPVARGFVRARGHDASLLSALAKLAFWLVLLGWISWSVFHWLRDAFATPAPIASTHPRAAVDLDHAIAAAAGAALFGEAATRAVAPQAGGGVPEIKLKGVFASGAGPVAAIVNKGGEDESVLLNGSLGPGVVLQGVYPSHIEISRSGATHRVDLEALKSEPARPKTAAKRPLQKEPAPASEPETAPAASSKASGDEAAPGAPEVSPPAPLAPPMQHSRSSPFRSNPGHA